LPGSNFNILLIDDSEREAKLFETALLQVAPRLKLYWVATVKEGLEYLRQEGRFQRTGPVNIVICDLNLPGAGGLEFVAEMKKDPAFQPIPLIVFSGSQAREDIHRAYSLGANSYLVKPMTLDMLARQLDLLVKYWFDTVKLPA